MLRRTLLIVALAAVMVGNNATAHEVDQATITQLSRQWLAQRYGADGARRTIREITPVGDAPVGVSAYLVRLQPRGYLVFMGDSRLPPILAFSLNSDIDLTRRDRETPSVPCCNGIWAACANTWMGQLAAKGLPSQGPAANSSRRTRAVGKSCSVSPRAARLVWGASSLPMPPSRPCRRC